MKNPRTHAIEIMLALVTLSLPGLSEEPGQPEVKNPTYADGFERPFRMKSGSKVIDVTNGNAAPCLIDLYGEGKRALLVGEFGEEKYKGKASVPDSDHEWTAARVRVYRNLG